MVPKMSSSQTLIYDSAALLTAYTYDQMVELAKEFDADSALETPGSLIFPKAVVDDAINGLCKYGYFTPSIVGYGSYLDLDDWRFTKVSPHPSYDAPGPTVSWVIPFVDIQGETIVGVAP